MTEQEAIDGGYKDGKKSFEYHAKRIGETFNFDNVHKAMIALNWEWLLGRDEDGMDRMGIPSIATIKNSAYRYLKHAYETGEQNGSGGFIAGWEDEVMYLTFSLEQATSD